MPGTLPGGHTVALVLARLAIAVVVGNRSNEGARSQVHIAVMALIVVTMIMATMIVVLAMMRVLVESAGGRMREGVVMSLVLVVRLMVSVTVTMTVGSMVACPVMRVSHRQISFDRILSEVCLERVVAEGVGQALWDRIPLAVIVVQGGRGTVRAYWGTVGGLRSVVGRLGGAVRGLGGVVGGFGRIIRGLGCVIRRLWSVISRLWSIISWLGGIVSGLRSTVSRSWCLVRRLGSTVSRRRRLVRRLWGSVAGSGGLVGRLRGSVTGSRRLVGWLGCSVRLRWDYGWCCSRSDGDGCHGRPVWDDLDRLHILDVPVVVRGSSGAAHAQRLLLVKVRVGIARVTVVIFRALSQATKLVMNFCTPIQKYRLYRYKI